MNKVIILFGLFSIGLGGQVEVDKCLYYPGIITYGTSPKSFSVDGCDKSPCSLSVGSELKYQYTFTPSFEITQPIFIVGNTSKIGFFVEQSESRLQDVEGFDSVTFANGTALGGAKSLLPKVDYTFHGTYIREDRGSLGPLTKPSLLFTFWDKRRSHYRQNVCFYLKIKELSFLEAVWTILTKG